MSTQRAHFLPPFLLVFALFAHLAPRTAGAQSSPHDGAFVTMLGADTVQVERFAQRGSSIVGVLVTRAPKAHMVRYDITLDATGRIARYAQTHSNGDGTPTVPDPGLAVMTYAGDSIIREALQRDGTPVTHRIFAPGGAYPLSTIPIGCSFLMFELALASARFTPSGQASAQPLAASPTLNRLLPMAAQAQPSRTRILYAAPDSVDVDYFGQGRFGFRFDTEGRIVRSDWRQTTYRVLVTRVAALDVETIASRWAAQDAAGTGAGPLSPRDSVLGHIGTAAVVIRYSRPSRRGRVIWGAVVPYDAVWRLGADFATQFTTDADVMLGDTVIPAGDYTLWMFPSATAPQLIVSKLVRVFGTQYNPAQDLARIPLARASVKAPMERLTLSVGDGALRIEWDDRAYTVSVRSR